MSERSATCICGGTGCQVCKVEQTLRSFNELPLLEAYDALKAENERLRAVLARIADGATGYLDRDAELAAWAREAVEK